MKTRTLKKNRTKRKKSLRHAWSLTETKRKATPKGNNTTYSMTEVGIFPVKLSTRT